MKPTCVACPHRKAQDEAPNPKHAPVVVRDIAAGYAAMKEQCSSSYDGQFTGFLKGFDMTHTTAARLLSLERLRGELDKALAAYQAAPNAHTLLSLNKAALPLMVEVPKEKPWRQVSFLPNDTVSCDFTAIRVVVDKRLVEDDVQRLAKCLGYGLKATLVGEELGEPSASYTASEEDDGLVFTLVEFAYNTSSTTRTRPNAKRAFEVVRDYIKGGSPIRTTDREGPGTMNTRLAEGISVPANLTFYVR